MTIIREATALDIPRIMELYEELAGEKQDATPERIQRAFNEIISTPNQHFLVAEQGNVVVGTLFVLIVANLSHGARPWAILENMIVDSRYRNQGIGRKLIESALAYCREAGCCKAQLLSNNKRKVAHQFYRSLGLEDSALGFRINL